MACPAGLLDDPKRGGSGAHFGIVDPGNIDSRSAVLDIVCHRSAREKRFQRLRLASQLKQREFHSLRVAPPLSGAQPQRIRERARVGRRRRLAARDGRVHRIDPTLHLTHQSHKLRGRNGGVPGKGHGCECVLRLHLERLLLQRIPPQSGVPR